MKELLTIVQELQLPIFVFVGVVGFVLCTVGDYYKNKGIREASRQELTYDEDGNYIKPPNPYKPNIVCFNMAGFILLFSSLIALWHYGYFDKYLQMMFG